MNQIDKTMCILMIYGRKHSQIKSTDLYPIMETAFYLCNKPINYAKKVASTQYPIVYGWAWDLVTWYCIRIT